MIIMPLFLKSVRLGRGMWFLLLRLRMMDGGLVRLLDLDLLRKVLFRGMLISYETNSSNFFKTMPQT
jgi:hypothetical protein